MSAINLQEPLQQKPCTINSRIEWENFFEAGFHSGLIALTLSFGFSRQVDCKWGFCGLLLWCDSPTRHENAGRSRAATGHPGDARPCCQACRAVPWTLLQWAMFYMLCAYLFCLFDFFFCTFSGTTMQKQESSPCSPSSMSLLNVKL